MAAEMTKGSKGLHEIDFAIRYHSLYAFAAHHRIGCLLVSYLSLTGEAHIIKNFLQYSLLVHCFRSYLLFSLFEVLRM